MVGVIPGAQPGLMRLGLSQLGSAQSCYWSGRLALPPPGRPQHPDIERAYVCRKSSSINSIRRLWEYSWSKPPSRSWRNLRLPVTEVHGEESELGTRWTDLGHVLLPDLAQGRRGWEGVAALEQESGHQARGLQPGDVALKEDAIHRPAGQGGVVAQQGR